LLSIDLLLHSLAGRAREPPELVGQLLCIHVFEPLHASHTIKKTVYRQHESARSGEHFGGIDKSLLTGAWEVHADARTARAAELPTGSIKAGGIGQIAGLGDLLAVGEADRLGPGTGEAEPDLASCLEVVDEVLE